MNLMIQPQTRDTVAHAAGDSGPSTLLIFLLIVGVAVAAYFIWKAVQNRKDPPTTPSTQSGHK
jgi:hypothetical protein